MLRLLKIDPQRLYERQKLVTVGNVSTQSRERSTVNNDAEIKMMNRKRARRPAAVADVLITYQ